MLAFGLQLDYIFSNIKRNPKTGLFVSTRVRASATLVASKRVVPWDYSERRILFQKEGVSDVLQCTVWL